MPTRPGTVAYWSGASIGVMLVAAALLWNAWTINQHGVAQRQLDALGVDPTVVAENEASSDGEIDLLLEADRRGILEDTFIALLTEPQKRALAKARQVRLAETSGGRTTSMIFGFVMALAGIAAFLAGRRA
jgi:hypothetical protein